MQVLVRIGLLNFVKKVKLLISIVFVLNIFLKKLKNLSEQNTKTKIFRVQSNNSIMCGYFCIGFLDFMLANKAVTDFTNLFSPYDFEKIESIILSYLKLNEIDKTSLTNQTKFRLNEISKIENYFNSEIKQRKLCSKKLSKYVTAFDCIDKILSVVSVTTGGVCMVSHATIVGTPVGIANVGFTIVFSLATGIIKKLLNKKQKEKA